MNTGTKREDTDSPRSTIFTSLKEHSWLISMLVVVWVISTITAFWWFQFRNIQSFDLDAVINETVFFESGELGARLENLVKSDYSQDKNKPISVIHFWNPDCPCNRFNEVHVKKIIADYADKNVKFIIVVSGSNEKQRKYRHVLAKQVFNHPAVKEIRSDWPMHEGPPSSPAVGVLNQEGNLVYFGPYSLGARCAPDQGTFVEKVLDRLSLQNSKKDNKQLNTIAVGCFCPWRTVD